MGEGVVVGAENEPGPVNVRVTREKKTGSSTAPSTYFRATSVSVATAAPLNGREDVDDASCLAIVPILCCKLAFMEP